MAKRNLDVYCFVPGQASMNRVDCTLSNTSIHFLITNKTGHLIINSPLKLSIIALISVFVIFSALQHLKGMLEI